LFFLALGRRREFYRLFFEELMAMNRPTNRLTLGVFPFSLGVLALASVGCSGPVAGVSDVTPKKPLAAVAQKAKGSPVLFRIQSDLTEQGMSETSEMTSVDTETEVKDPAPTEGTDPKTEEAPESSEDPKKDEAATADGETQSEPQSTTTEQGTDGDSPEVQLQITSTGDDDCVLGDKEAAPSTVEVADQQKLEVSAANESCGMAIKGLTIKNPKVGAEPIRLELPGQGLDVLKDGGLLQVGGLHGFSASVRVTKVETVDGYTVIHVGVLVTFRIPKPTAAHPVTPTTPAKPRPPRIPHTINELDCDEFEDLTRPHGAVHHHHAD
jgi:hypothetical protein